jgi:uncharacterized protein (TIGR01244 family)
MLYCLRTIVCWSCLSLCVLTHADHDYLDEPNILAADGFQQVFSRVAPNIYVSGQPTPSGLAKAKELGVTTVVNLRTAFEMNDRGTVDFDEAAEIDNLGLTYVHIPQGGPDTPYSPAAVAKFASAVKDAKGNVLLHCTVAWRASHLWAAYLVEYHDVPLPLAVGIGKQVNLGSLPLEGFLGKKLEFGLK